MGPIRPGFRSFCQQIMKQILDRNFFGHGLQCATELHSMPIKQQLSILWTCTKRKASQLFGFTITIKYRKGRCEKYHSLCYFWISIQRKRAFFVIHRHNQTPSVQKGKPSHGTPVRSCPTIWFAIGARILVVVWRSKSGGCTVPGTRYRANGLIIEIMELDGIRIL